MSLKLWNLRYDYTYYAEILETEGLTAVTVNKPVDLHSVVLLEGVVVSFLVFLNSHVTA